MKVDAARQFVRDIHPSLPDPSKGLRDKTMAAHCHRPSLGGILETLIPFSLTLQQRESAKHVVIKLMRHYGPERTVPKGYRPAALIHAILEHVAYLDTFLNFFLSYIYGGLCFNEGPVVDFDITHALSYFNDWPSWEPEQIHDLTRSIEKFAEFIVDDFLLPRMPLTRLYLERKHMLIGYSS